MLALRFYFWDDWPAPVVIPPGPPSSGGGFGIPTLFVDRQTEPFRRRQVASGGSTAIVIITAEAAGLRQSFGSAVADASILASASAQGRKRGVGGVAAQVGISAMADGVADDLELLLALYLAQATKGE